MGDLLRFPSSLDELDELEAEAQAVIEGDAFTASDGRERKYPLGLAAVEREEYRAFVERQIEANAHNHDHIVGLVKHIGDLTEGEAP